MAACAAPDRFDSPSSDRELVRSALEQHSREQPSRTAIARRHLDGSFEETSYRTLLGWTLGYARLIQSRTAEASIVPLCYGRSAQAVAAMLGVLVSGRAFCSLNPKLRPPQIERVLADTGAALALADATGLASLKGAAAPGSRIAGTHWILVQDASFGPRAEELALELARSAATERFEPVELSPALGPAPRGPVGAPHVVAACLFTSGSTGVPKGVLVGAADLIARARAELGCFGVNRSDVLLGLLPFSFDVGLNQLLCSVLAGAELVLLDSWLPLDIRRVISERKVTGVSAVPAIWADFLRANLALDRSGAHRTLRYLTISGGDLSPDQHARLARFVGGAGVYKTYGQTEAFRATCLLPHEYAERPESVGRPFPGVNVYVAREDGRRARAGELGEVVHSGLGVMLGYLGGDDPERKLRENPFRSANDDNPLALFTGDHGYVDDAGYLFLRGRRDDLIKRNGNRVYPSEVRNQLAAVPGVALAEVVIARVADEARLAGFVVPELSSRLDSTSLRRELAQRVPAYMVPDFLSIREELPRTASGKPDRPALAALAEQALASSPAGAAKRTPADSATSGWDRVLSEIARTHETPCFVYFLDLARARIAAIRRAFGGRLGVSFAMKCNPHPAILKNLMRSVDGLDVSSAGELETAIACGWPAESISFTGPAKQARDLEAALRHRVGEVVVESVREARLLARAAASAGVRQKILVRIAPARVPKGFGVNMAGRPCQFGIDEEDLDAALPELLDLPGLELAGFHLFSGTQCLKPLAIAENYAIFLEIAARAAERHALAPVKLVFGSGLGIPYHEGDPPLDLDEIARVASPEIDRVLASSRLAGARIWLETGRYLLGEAGVYLVRVVNRKRSRGAELAVLDGGMNHHLGAAGHLGMAIHRNYRLFKVHSERGDADAIESEFDLYGPLCTSIDVLGRGVRFRGLDVGDVIGVRSSGAYALTASPVHFISHPPPCQLLVSVEGGRVAITEMEAASP